MPDQFDLLAEDFAEKEAAAQVDGYNAQVPGSFSMFNPFNIFRYSAFGLTPGYRRELHIDGSKGVDGLESFGVIPKSPAELGLSNVGDILSQFGVDDDARKTVENPTATAIIDWSQAKASKASASASGATPYATTDFLWCKWYGKIPNNRLVTLRRYPIPVEDNLIVSSKKMPLVPIAQAITWFGSDVSNPLSSVLNLGWGFNWKALNDVDVQDIQGNEVTVEELLAAVGAGELDENVVATIKNLISEGDTTSLAKLAGVDSIFNDYIKNAYNPQKGPYWNRILGPVNVIDSTYIRSRGFEDNKTNQIKLKFEYSLRSYAGINPKIAFLDLLTNFLSLTYNTAPFWGGGARYFEREGVTIPSLGFEQKFFEGDVYGAVKMGLAEINEIGKSRFKEIIGMANDLVQGAGGKEVASTDRELISRKKDFDQRTQVDILEKGLAPRLGALMQKPLSFRSVLDGRAIGEWHITIGNPMNPIANIGNLIVKSVDFKLGEVLGVDDFPTEMEFTVTLEHGRPRAKQDIESIFNMGNGAMSFNELSPPSSARNSYGEYNTALLSSAIEGGSPEDFVGRTSLSGDEDPFDVARDPFLAPNEVQTRSQGGAVNTVISGSRAGSAGDGVNAASGSGGSRSGLDSYKSRIGKRYGEGFKSEILTDYFNELKTRD